MAIKKVRYFVGDFETTVYEGQEDTEVWASACVELFTEDVQIHHSIAETYEYLKSLNCNIICYYHNLKFDGVFWLSYLLVQERMKQGFLRDPKTGNIIGTPKEQPNNTITYSISGMGQWYRITVKVNNCTIEFRDSLKLLPFSVKRIGDSFRTQHKKLDMEYTGFRYAGCTITDEEKGYIRNDVLVIKEALEIMFTEGHKKLTIGSCCLSEYKKSIGNKKYKVWFPDLYGISISSQYGSDNVGAYIHRSYHGGWCYLVKGKEGVIKRNGTTADVNSLYPSMMSSESSNCYPIGEPTFWQGDTIPTEAQQPDKYFFVRFTCRFRIKPGKLPFIQIKNSFLYKATQMLETSDVYDAQTGQYYSEYIDFDGSVKPATVTLTMTQTDWALFREHYDVSELVIHDGCYFDSKVGIFDEYIEKYKQIKLTSKGALRELAKLFLNNLYGKMASSPVSNFKVAYIKDDRTLGFETIQANDKTPGFIAVGSAITSYARNFTIRAAQKNFHGIDKPGFVYADTDSIHCDLPPDKIVGITVHPKNFCAWKLEACWDEGYFVRQKTYIEHIIAEDCEPIKNPYYNIKCAGMPEHCKNLFLMSMQGAREEELSGLPDDEKEFVKEHRTLADFNIGLRVPGKLRPKQLRGGVLLTTTTYEMR